MGEKKWGGVWKWTVVERGQNRSNYNGKAGLLGPAFFIGKTLL